MPLHEPEQPTGMLQLRHVDMQYIRSMHSTSKAT